MSANDKDGSSVSSKGGSSVGNGSDSPVDSKNRSSVDNPKGKSPANNVNDKSLDNPKDKSLDNPKDKSPANNVVESDSEDDLVQEIYTNINKAIGGIRGELTVAKQKLDGMIELSSEFGSKLSKHETDIEKNAVDSMSKIAKEISDREKAIKKKEEDIKLCNTIIMENKAAIMQVRNANTDMRNGFNQVKQEVSKFAGETEGKLGIMHTKIIQNNTQLIQQLDSRIVEVNKQLDLWKEQCYSLPKDNEKAIEELQKIVEEHKKYSDSNRSDLDVLALELSQRTNELKSSLLAVENRDKDQLCSLTNTMDSYMKQFSLSREKAENVIAGDILAHKSILDKHIKDTQNVSSEHDKGIKKCMLDLDSKHNQVNSRCDKITEELKQNNNHSNVIQDSLQHQIKSLDERLQKLEQSHAALINRTKQTDHKIKTELDVASETRKYEIPNLEDIARKLLVEIVKDFGFATKKDIFKVQQFVKGSVTSQKRSLECYMNKPSSYTGPGNI